MCKKNTSLLLMYCFVVALTAQQRPDTLKVYEIPEFAVTEQYRNTEVRSTTPLQILSSPKIEKLNVLQLSDAIKHFSGVLVKDFGGIGGLKTVSVRGLGATHTAVSYDGVALTDVQTGQIDIGRFSLENIEQISLNNGQGDNIFQPARLFASASILNIRSKTPEFCNSDYLNGRIGLKQGSFGLLNPFLNLQYRLSDKLSGSFSTEWLSANGDYSYKLDQSYAGSGIRTFEQRKNSDVKNFRVESALFANISKNESAFLKAYFYKSERGLPGATILYNEGAFVSQRMWDNTFFVQAHYQKDFNPLLSMQINSKYNHGYLHYLDTVVLNSQGYEESRFRQNEYYTSVSFLYRAFQHLSFSLSTDGSFNDMKADFENTSLTQNFALPKRYSLLSVLAAKYVSESVFATASLLSTITSDKTKTGIVIADQNRLSPYVSFSYKPLSAVDLRLRTFYKNIFRLPAFNDLYYARVGNVNLLPEKTNQFNIGMTYALKPTRSIQLLSITVDAYQNNVKDKIVAIPNKNIFVWSMVNMGQVKISGLDVSFECSVFPWKSTGFIAGASYSYQRALDVTLKGSGTYNHQLPYTPRISGSARWGFQSDLINISYALIWSGARYAGFQNFAENRLPAYADHSVSASRNFKLKNNLLSANVEVLNILNQNYAVVKWYPMPGRSYRITLAYKF